MSSRIAVFNEGVVQQYASPDDLYERPANAFVANFIGENNLISATLSKGAGTDTVGAALQCGTPLQARNGNCGASDVQDRTSVVYGKMVTVSVDPGGRRIIKKKK